MKAQIYIISGFLGAGKTTLIQKLLAETLKDKRVALIENDFGEISVDAALLQASGIEIKEINAGCICCSLSGDFAAALQELLQHFSPEILIIEPSGVGKLSDTIKVCHTEKVQQLAEIKQKITVVDVKRCQTYLENFGEFFEDQIQHADSILLSRTEQFPAEIASASAEIQRLNPHAVLFSGAWQSISSHQLLTGTALPAQHDVHTAHHHCHDGCCHHGHHHAEDIFDTVTIALKGTWHADEIKDKILHAAKGSGKLLRAKGIFPTQNGYLTLQYLPDDLQLTPSAVSGETLCLIGQALSRSELQKIFSKE